MIRPEFFNKTGVTMVRSKSSIYELSEPGWRNKVGKKGQSRDTNLLCECCGVVPPLLVFSLVNVKKDLEDPISLDSVGFIY